MKRRALLVLTVFLPLLSPLLAGCGRSVPAIERLPPDAVILAFGDSLTFGTGAQAHESYPATLEKLIGRKVENRGIPGEVTASGLARLPGVLDEVQPKLLILCHGGNDLLRKLDEAQAEKNLRAMIKVAKARGIAVTLVGVPKPGFFPAPPGFYEALAGEFKVPYEGDSLMDILSDNELKSDLVHPNAKGYRRFASSLAELLKSSGAV